MNPAAAIAKKKNLKKIMQYIVDHEEPTRITIAQALDLSVATVTNNINDLMELNLVSVGEKISGNRGRKATILRFKGEEKYVVTVSMYIQSLLITLIDFNKNVIRDTQKITFLERTKEKGETICEMFTQIISTYIDNLDENERNKIECMTIAVTGIVSRDKQVYASYYDWFNISLLDQLLERYDFPIYCDNVTRYKALEEVRLMNCEMMNVIYLYMGVGVAAVQFFGNRIIEGRNGASGEIGHICLEPYGEPCHCGNRGCVERYCGENYMLEEAEKLLGTRDSCEILEHLVYDLNEPLTIETLMMAEEMGSMKVHGLFTRMAYYIGKTLSFIFNVMDPDCVIVAGKLMEKCEFVYNNAVKEMRKNIVNVDAREICLNKAKIREEHVADVLAQYAINRYIKDYDFEF